MCGKGFLRLQSGWWGQVLSPSRPPRPCNPGNSFKQLMLGQMIRHPGALMLLRDVSSLARFALVPSQFMAGSSWRLMEGAIRITVLALARLLVGSLSLLVLHRLARLCMQLIRGSANAVASLRRPVLEVAFLCRHLFLSGSSL